MSSKLEQALAAVRRLPRARQDELAEALALVAEIDARPYSDVEVAAIDEGLADADAGRFVSDEELAATLARFRAV